MKDLNEGVKWENLKLAYEEFQELKNLIPKEEFDMEMYFSGNPKEHAVPNCGHAACACGWMPSLRSEVFHIKKEDMFNELTGLEDINWDNYNSRVFGTHNGEAWAWLFDSLWIETTIEDFLLRLKYFIDNKAVPDIFITKVDDDTNKMKTYFNRDNSVKPNIQPYKKD